MRGWTLPRAERSVEESQGKGPDEGSGREQWPVVLIPAYQPTPQLPEMVRELSQAEGVQAVVIVNDGSSPDCDGMFAAAAQMENVHILHHAVNCGKGMALKSGFNYILCAFPRSAGVITADADGQHSTQDIQRLGAYLAAHPEELTIGAREFSGDVPWRSYVGNTLTNFVFGCLTGRSLQDTQSGLRAIPARVLADLLRLDGMRYEFEMNMLFWAASNGLTIRELPIETIYLEGNRSSHFHPLADSAKIYSKLLQFYASSALAAVLDLAVFGLAMRFSGHLLFSFLIGRVLIAGLVNFNLNRRFVFSGRGNPWRSLAKYYASFAVLGTISYFCIRAMIAAGFAPLLAKTLVESVLSVISFAVQGVYVFAERKMAKA